MHVSNYSIIVATRPEPTVRPPSRLRVNLFSLSSGLFTMILSYFFDYFLALFFISHFFRTKNVPLYLALSNTVCYTSLMGKLKPGGLPSFSEGLTLQTKERRAIPMITYSELIQFAMFVVALVSLCYKVFKDKRN